jgi:DNA repair photolyase
MSPKHEKIKIITKAGETVDSIAPVIVSASRSTDIPAFYAKWFMERLKDGYTVWTNPFNGHSQFISFKNTRLIAFWSKNPEPLICHFDKLDQMCLNNILHFTLNDYEHECFEPHVPPLNKRIDTFIKISKRIGCDKIYWRFDPVIITEDLTVDRILQKIKTIGNEIAPYTGRLTISILANYPKVKRNMTKKNVLVKEADLCERMYLYESISELCRGWGIEVFTCAEDPVFNQLGIRNGACLDIEKISSSFSDDAKLMDFIGSFSGDLFGDRENVKKKLKDPGQRKNCGCVISKDIGAYDTCPHYCLYCYANSSPECKLKTFCQ